MQNATDKAKSDRLKAIIAGALAVVFAAVVAMRLAPGTGSDTNDDAQTTLRVPPRTDVAAPAHQPTSPASPRTGWAPTIDVERIVERNPFQRARRQRVLQLSAKASTRRPNSFESPEEGPRAVEAAPAVELPESLAEVQAIAHGAKPAVLVDGQLVQERDIVYGQWRVVRIGKESIVVEPVE